MIQFRRVRILWVSLFLVFPFISAFAASADPFPYMRRGNEIEPKVKEYRAKLEGLYQGLVQKIQTEMPDVYARLKKSPPQPIRHGYQMLPKITSDPRDGKPARAVSTSYSWKRTEAIVSGEIEKMRGLEERRKVADSLTPAERKGAYSKIVDDYLAIIDPNRQIVDSHFNYNRFWQNEIARDRKRYDRLTVLHDQVMERQTILDQLAAQAGRPEKKLQERARLLEEQIHRYGEDISLPSYVVLKKAGPRHWKVEVPLFTDIVDSAFLDRFRAVIENRWKAEENGDKYEVLLKLKSMKFDQPKPGEIVDFTKHVEKFPKDGAVLTTGALSTHAIPGRYVALGAIDIQENVLAHEFGHILGFTDIYFRGYRDRGADGFEVLEVIPDPDDIMCSPGYGRVHGYHFRAIKKNRVKLR